MNEPPLLRLVALVALVGTYLGLGLGHVPGFRLDRTGIAIIGATVMVALIVVEAARKHGVRIGFLEYCRLGLPLTLVTLLLGWLILISLPA